jgi:peptidoglycan/LPS O-acetylase OafA/YrhL
MHRVSLAAFYTRRALRIVPAAVLLVGTVWCLASLGYITLPPRSIWLAATFGCNMSTECDWFLGHLWSLAVEEQFYLVWPCLALLAGARSVPKLAAALMAGFLVLSQLRVGNVGRVDNGMSFACIAVGCFYASSPKVRAAIARATSPALLALATAILICRPTMPMLFRGSQRLQDLLTPVMICFVLFSTLGYRERLERLLTVRLLARLGLISYGLYLWQQLFLAAPDKYLRLSFASYPILCLPIVAGSYYLMERPLIRLGARLSKVMVERGSTNSRLKIANRALERG